MSKLIVYTCGYNCEKTMRQTIDSVLNQTFADFDYYFINNGSTDGTAKILDEYAKKDDRIKAYFKENEGVTKARLYGVTKAIGDWIGFVDSDDFVKPEMYEKLYKIEKLASGYKVTITDGENDAVYEPTV